MIEKQGEFEIDIFKHGFEVYTGGLPDGVHNAACAYCELLPDERLIKLYLLHNTEYDYYILHECVHAADFILNNIGANMGTDPDQSEIRAYLAEYIYCKVGCVLGTLKYDPTIRIHETSCKKGTKRV